MRLILKELRKKHNLTQAELAKMLEVSRSTIAQVESGNNSLSLDLAKKISSTFNVNLSSLLEGNDTDVVGDIYKNDIDGFQNSLYVDFAHLQLYLDEIEIIKHSLSEFAKEKNLKGVHAKFDKCCKETDFNKLKDTFNSTNHNKLSQLFINDFWNVILRSKSAILQDLADIVTFYYKSRKFYYDEPDL